MKGRSYSTLYGYIWVEAPGPTQDGARHRLKVHGCGESCHHICPPPNSPPREAFHDPAEPGEPRKRRLPRRWQRSVAPGIVQQHNDRYSARHKRKRLGTFETQAQAQLALDRYGQEMEVTKRHTKSTRQRKQKEPQQHL